MFLSLKKPFSVGDCSTYFMKFFIHRINISLGALEERMMLSGLHTVADIFCCSCGQIVGWKYVNSLILFQITSTHRNQMHFVSVFV